MAESEDRDARICLADLSRAEAAFVEKLHELKSCGGDRGEKKRLAKELEKNAKQCKNPNAAHFQNESGMSLLFHSSEADCLEGVKILLDRGADPLWQNERGDTILHLLAKNNQVEMAEAVFAKINALKRVEFLNLPSHLGWTPLMLSCEHGHEEFSRWAVAKGANVNAKMDTGWTSLHSAAKNDNAKLVRFLLEKGADRETKAAHRDFGRNLSAEDVTVHEETIAILNE